MRGRSNLTVARSVGQKQKADESLSGSLIVLGKQPGAPVVDLYLVAR